MNHHLPRSGSTPGGNRVNRPSPRDMQVRHLSRRYGLSHQQACLVAGFFFGEGKP